MVHILREKIDNNVVYLLLKTEPTARELEKIEEFEYVGNLNLIGVKPGQYTSTQLYELLEVQNKKADKQIEALERKKRRIIEMKEKLKEFMESIK